MRDAQNYPVMHFLLRCGCQADWPSLLRPLRCVQCKGVLGFIQHFNYNGHFIQEHMDVLRREKKPSDLRQTFHRASIFALKVYKQGIPAKDSKESILGTEGMGLNFQPCTTSNSYCLQALTLLVKTLFSQARLFTIKNILNFQKNS